MLVSFAKRGRFGIVYDILVTCTNPVLKTHILYGCNLNFSQLERYLTLLISVELLEHVNEEERELYKTTAKGKKFIVHYENVTGLLATDLGECVRKSVDRSRASC